MMHAHDMKELKGPVYDCDKNHKFQQLVMHAHELKNLMLPVYGVEGKSGYQPPIEKKDVIMPINGMNNCNNDSQVFLANDPFFPPGPVYKGVESSNQYNPQTEKQVGDRIMTGPKLPGVVSANSYQPMEGPTAITEKVMAAPHYR